MAHSSPRRRTLALAALVGVAGATALAAEAALADPATTGKATSAPTAWSQTALGRAPIAVKMSGQPWSSSRQGIDVNGNPDDRLLAYCIELTRTARTGVAMQQIPWSRYPGANAAGDNLPKINWVVNHSIAATGRADMETAVARWLSDAGRPPLTNGLQAQEALSGTQAALWHLSDDRTLADVRSPDARSTAAGAAADTRKVYEYFLAQAQDRAEDAGPRGMSVSPADSSGVAGGLIGPMTVRTTGDKVRLTSALPAGVNLVDSTGAAVAADDLRDGQKVYVKTAADAPAGAVNLTFASDRTVQAYAGQVFTGASVRTQSYVVASHQYGTATDSAVIRWTAAPRPPTTPPATGGPPAPVAPAVTTSASDRADGDKTIAPTGGRVVDVVTYSGLTPSTAHTVTGVLMDKATGTATGVRASRTFTTPAATGGATRVDGTVEVEFAVPAALAGQTLVAFETVRDDDVVVAAHRDIDDLAQTVGVGVAVTGGAPAPVATPVTGGALSGLPVTGASLGALVGAGVLGLGAGGVLLAASRRRRAAARS
ncbi:hypothetical protein GCM10010124_33250 [Pilimelia terevasa]|uniref:TQXA domain-containing protein n=1 Tax=Pilimelia terevasa TaxID=53372 RepID=A0A8J3BT39_9ACTN|nr:VaFE repeat-containing surface-anchored protein [Pilimelia terevasa]GGK37791.1 hypothetical protein GCM10010124_33250 [Pilimelia terevasa]